MARIKNAFPLKAHLSISTVSLVLAVSIFAFSTPLASARETPRSHISKSHPKKHAHKKAEKPAAAEPPAAAPSEGDSSLPFEPQLLRLAEILGALNYLEPLCGQTAATDWRAEVTALIETEAKTDLARETITGAYNHGYRGYALSYRICTPNAQKIISRFTSEGGKIAKDIVNHYGAT